MHVDDDKDIVRALGLLILNAAYTEECIDELLDAFSKKEVYRKNSKSNETLSKINDLLRMIDQLIWKYDEDEILRKNLLAAKNSLEDRNIYVHDRYYTHIENGKSNVRPGRNDRKPCVRESGEIYTLVNNLDQVASCLRSALYAIERTTKK